MYLTGRQFQLHDFGTTKKCSRCSAGLLVVKYRDTVIDCLDQTVRVKIIHVCIR